MARLIKRKVFQVHGAGILIACFSLFSIFILIIALCTADEKEVYLAWLYMWLGWVGLCIIAYVGIHCEAGTDYFDETGMTRKFCKKIRFELSWIDVRLLKYRKWVGIIPICSIGVPNGTFSDKTLKKILRALSSLPELSCACGKRSFKRS